MDDIPQSWKTGAKLIGWPLSRYVAARRAGKHWCGRCKMFHPAALFVRDRSRPTGLSARCRIGGKR